MYETKIEDVYEGFSKDKKMFDFSDYSGKSKYCNDSNKLVVGKMKDETGGVDFEQFVGLKPKLYSFMVYHRGEHKKAQGPNKNVVARISYGEYRDVLLNNKCLRHLMNRLQSKYHKRGTYKINKPSLSCLYDKIYILNNGYDGLVLGY